MMRTLPQGAALQIPTAQTQNKVIIDVEKITEHVVCIASTQNPFL